MSEQINTAIILAAGMGSRLGVINENKPKGFLRIGSLPIIHESINKLKKAEIKNIVIVTGYQSQLYDAYIEENFQDIKIVKNLDYEHTSTLYSLSKIRTFLKDDFLLLESDLIYDFSAISELLSNKSRNTILLSNETGSGDEVYVETSNNNLVNMSKDLNKLKTNSSGEFVGINKISYSLFQKMMGLFDRSTNRKILTYEEDAMVQCSRFIDIECLKLDELLWSEIDTKEHLEKAKEIYKKLS